MVTTFEIKEVFQVRYKRRWLLLIVSILVFALLLGLTQAVRHVQEERADCQCQGNAYSLATALLGYRDLYGCLPPPFISDQFGKPLYSWRVLVMAGTGESAWEEFDYTKTWNDPVNMQLANKGHNEVFLKNRFSCPSIKHEKTGQTDYFYVLNAEDSWPRDFLLDANSPSKVLLVESQWRNVYWSEPVDFVYEKSGQGFLEKLRETNAPHPAGFNCVTSDRLSLKVPYAHIQEHDLPLLTHFPQQVKGKEGADNEQIDRLVAKLMESLSDAGNNFKNLRRPALLLLGELGPRAAPAVPAIRRIMAEGDKSLGRIAALALARIEK